MTDIQLFNIDGEGMRFGATDSGRPFVVAADFAPKLGYARSRDALRLVEEDEKGAQSVRTPGGPQEMQVLYEDGIWELIFLSRKPEAKAIKKRVKEVLRTIRETGHFQSDPMDELALAERNVELIKEKRALAERAAAAELKAAEGASFRTAIEAGDGLRPRDFHKKYFSEIADRAFFEHLYAKGYLIDQRGKGGYGHDGRLRNGPDHGRPGFKGKHFFYLHNSGVHGGKRREHTRVRPGQAELEFKARLITDGLVANTNSTGQLSIEEVA